MWVWGLQENDGGWKLAVGEVTNAKPPTVPSTGVLMFEHSQLPCCPTAMELAACSSVCIVTICQVVETG